MAGIGFELRRSLKKGTLLSILQAYSFAGVISAGPWVLSVVGMLIVGFIARQTIANQQEVIAFLVTVTYLMAFSLVLTGLLTLVFTRFIADRIFANNEGSILPNLMGSILLTIVIASLFSGMSLFFFDEAMLFKFLLLSNFVVLCLLWIVIIFISGMKDYLRIVITFAIGYAIVIIFSYLLSTMGKEGLLLALLFGHGFLVFSLLHRIFREYDGDELVSFEFLDRKHVFPSLALTGLFFYLGVWIDKFIFWFHPLTSQEVIGPLRASIIYDLPIFLAYLSIIPGMAVFLVRIEADFAEENGRFYKAITDGATFKEIRYYRNRMIDAARQGLYEILKVQGLTAVLLLFWGESILRTIGISTLYLPLFYIDVVAASLQVFLLALLNLLFYLDSRRDALMTCLIFLLSNALLTFSSIKLGVSFYGYGYAIAIIIASLYALYFLSKKIQRLEYETFVYQPLG